MSLGSETIPILILFLENQAFSRMIYKKKSWRRI